MILIISGSPKKDGICYSLVKTAEETVKEQNAKVKVLNLKELALNKCQMCGNGWGICFSEHHCMYDTDGFNEIQEDFDKAKGFVFISPVYWGEVSEDLKNFLDKLRRCQATKQWNKDEKEVSFLKGKPSILVASAGGGGGGILTALSQMERMVTHCGGDLHGDYPRETCGITDFIGVNRWNQDYKREALVSSVKRLVSITNKK